MIASLSLLGETCECASLFCLKVSMVKKNLTNRQIVLN